MNKQLFDKISNLRSVIRGGYTDRVAIDEDCRDRNRFGEKLPDMNVFGEEKRE